jgi:hypothetical protein
VAMQLLLLSHLPLTVERRKGAEATTDGKKFRLTHNRAYAAPVICSAVNRT